MCGDRLDLLTFILVGFSVFSRAAAQQNDSAGMEGTGKSGLERMDWVRTDKSQTSPREWQEPADLAALQDGQIVAPAAF